MRRLLLAVAVVFSARLSARPPALAAQSAPAALGYYRMPTVRGGTIVFVAEGDLWRVGIGGGTAVRLTSHPSRETSPAISPDGKTLAFTARYEGPAEVYTMPLEGGMPERRTWSGTNSVVTGWTPEGQVLYSSARRSTLPDNQLFRLDLKSGSDAPLPLSQAADGSYDPSGKTLYFTRQSFQGSHTKRYQGGTAEQIWKYAEGGAEAVPLTADFAGTSKHPMWWQGRIYFASDRDGSMNLWSMDESGKDLKQLTSHKGWDVQTPQLGDGKIVYQLGADLHVYDIAGGKDAQLVINLPSDFDQLREHWIQNPFDYLTAAHISANGDRVVLTARGQVFVAPAGQGRLVEATRKPGVRYRDARFFPDGKSLLALTTETGEVELTRLPANGVGKSEPLTSDGNVLRWEAVPSPDGKWIAHTDKNQQLWLYEVATKKNSRIAVNENGNYGDLRWSPDSRWLAFGDPRDNQFQRLAVYDTRSSTIVPVTSDRYDSYSPAWSPDGKWLYFLSDRHLESLIGGPWGARQPEPFFDRETQIFAVALRSGLRFPFQAADELQAGDSTATKADTAVKADKKKPDEVKKADSASKSVKVEIDTAGLVARLYTLPVPAGNLGNLAVTADRIYFLSAETGSDAKTALRTLAIDRKTEGPETYLEDVRSFEPSQDGKKLLIRKGNALYVMDAGAKGGDLGKTQVNLKSWTFPIVPREEWRQMFNEAWRLERDYFYDRAMHGNNWPAILAKYQPLSERVTDREELSDLLAQMVSELSALHIFVYGGDRRKAPDTIEPASLGAELSRDSAAGGYRIAHIYRSDPDEPQMRSPLSRVEWIAEGDLIESIDGTPLLSVPDPGVLLRNQAGQQVLLRIRPKSGAARDAVVVPISQNDAFDRRYDEWELTRRERVDKEGSGKIGYVHLRAMGSNDIAQWARDYYPVFDRDGLIIDVRHNNGGNIDSWVLEKLLRKAWFYWQGRVGKPSWNMQYAFRGHVVVICDEQTASDGEAFSEGFRRLGIGKVIGTRTWGGEIWLSSSNVLVDKGIATAAEFGVYGPEGAWLIEGHGVDPDITVDNLPHATFGGEDAQLSAAIKYLQEEIKAHPIPVPGPPAYPKKAQ
jgi:tricorn protease